MQISPGEGEIKNQPVLRVSIFRRRCSPLACVYHKEGHGVGSGLLEARGRGGGCHPAQGHLPLSRLGCEAPGWSSWPHDEGLKAVDLPTLLMSDDATV